MNNANGSLSKSTVYKLRRRNFKSDLIKKVAMLGYIVIILQYVKFGSRMIPLILRFAFQSFLASPFPNNELLIRTIQRLHDNDRENDTNTDSTNNNITDFNNNTNNSTTGPNIEINMPGGFINTNEEINLDQVSPDVVEYSDEDRLNNMKDKIRSTLFFTCIPLNVVLLLIHTLSPFDFTVEQNDSMINLGPSGKLGSQFTYGSGLIEGERRNGITIQMVGELIPRSNFLGNLTNVWFDFMILIVQLVLFTLTCINFARLGYKEPEEITQIESDGYDGKMIITRIDFENIIKEISF